MASTSPAADGKTRVTAFDPEGPGPRPEPAATPPPVSRLPDIPSPIPLERRGRELWMHAGERSFRVRGLEKNLVYEVLKVNVAVYRKGREPFVDNVDNLYASKQRKIFLKQASEELEVAEDVLKKDMGKFLRALEAAQEEAIQASLEPAEEKEVELTDEERDEALTLLRSPDLLGEILKDFERVGVVGEEENKLVGYLAAVSRKLDTPLALLIQSSSAAGKSSLMEAVLDFMPEEERFSYSAMTGQALYYLGETNLRHKILAIAEEEGAQKASYALKLLQSQGELIIASTGKDPVTGRLVTHIYKVKGPVMIFLTTTSIDMDEELLNRCLVLTVDESREQTRAIHQMQRRRQTLTGLLEDQERDKVLARHRNAQRLLRPLGVVNPYAEKLSFLDHQIRARRDHVKYLTLIRTVALLHQYQREVKTAKTSSGEEVSYIEVTQEDIRVANRLAHQVLGRSLDELPEQTRNLLEEISRLVEAGCREQGVEPESFRFTRRQVREWTGMGNTRLKVHLRRLEDFEYLLAHSGGRGMSVAYELLYPADLTQAKRTLPGLLDVAALADAPTDEDEAGEGPSPAGEEQAGSQAYDAGGGRGWSPRSRPQVVGWSPQGNPPEDGSQSPSKPPCRPEVQNRCSREVAEPSVVDAPVVARRVNGE